MKYIRQSPTSPTEVCYTPLVQQSNHPSCSRVTSAVKAALFPSRESIAMKTNTTDNQLNFLRRAGWRALLLLSLLLAGVETRAASDSWNVDADANWADTNSWLSGANIPGSTTIDNSDVATFSFPLTTNRTVTPDNPRYIGGISFGNPSTYGYNLSLFGGLFLNSGGVIQTLSANGDHTDTITSPITIDGASAATATFTAGASSSNSVLFIPGGVTGSATAGNTTTLILNGTNPGSNNVVNNKINGNIVDGAAGGNLAVVKDGTGSWTLSVANTFTGGLTVKNGTLHVNGNNAAMGNGTVYLGDTSGSANVTLVSDTRTFTQPITVQAGSSGTVTFANEPNTFAAATFSGPITQNRAFNIRANSSGNTRFLGAITGTNQITIDGGTNIPSSTPNAGRVYVYFGYLSANGLFTGPFVVNSGTLANSANSGPGVQNTIQINPGAAVDMATGPLTIAGLLDNAGAGGTVMNWGGAGANNLTLGGVGNYSFAGRIAPYPGIKIALVKTNTGTQTLSGDNTFSGNVTLGSATVTGGTLKLGHASALGFGGLQTTATGTTTVNSGSTLDLNGTTGINEPIRISGTGFNGDGALMNSSGAAATIGDGIAGLVVGATGIAGYNTPPTVAISGTGSGATATAAAALGVTTNSFTINGGTTRYSVRPNVAIAGNPFGVGAAATAITNALGAVTGITITAAGTGFTTNPVITFPGGTVAVAGTNPTGTGNSNNFCVGGLTMTAAGSGYTGTPVVTFNGSSVTVSSTLSSMTLIGDSSIGGTGDITINSVVSGRFDLTKVGLNALTLSGVNTYGGNTIISNGTLRLGNTGTLGFGSIQSTNVGATTVNSGAVLDLNGAANINEPITINGTGISANGALVNGSGAAASIGNGIAGIAVAATGSGSGYSNAPTVAISGTGSGATATASLGVTASSFTITNSDTTFLVAPTVNIGGGAGAKATADLDGGGIVTGITITNAGTGFGTTTNPPTITFTGGTVNVLGTTFPGGYGNTNNYCVGGLTLTAAGSGYTGTPTVTFDGSPAAVTPVLSSVVLGADSSLGGSGDITISGPVSGGFAVTKVGAGTLTLSGANTYSGPTTVNTGVLLISGNSSGATNAVTVATNATLGGVGTIGGAVTFSAGSHAELTVGSPLTLNDSLIIAASGTIPDVKLNLSNNVPAGTYTLATYNTSGSSGAFNSIVGAPNSGSFAANTTNYITTAGGQVNLVVQNVTPSTPSATNITYSVSGNQLVLNWPAGQGWTLQSQTNTRSIGLQPASNAWSTVTPTPTPPYTNTINAADPTVFYRLKY